MDYINNIQEAKEILNNIEAGMIDTLNTIFLDLATMVKNDEITSIHIYSSEEMKNYIFPQITFFNNTKELKLHLGEAGELKEEFQLLNEETKEKLLSINEYLCFINKHYNLSRPENDNKIVFSKDTVTKMQNGQLDSSDVFPTYIYEEFRQECMNLFEIKNNKKLKF